MKEISKNTGGSVRITGGEYRGRVIATPGRATHPMGERERLALFNMLGESVKRAKVLDTFAGGGTLGFEALSRGASRVTFVEKDHGACKVIGDNAAKLGCQDKCEVISSSIQSFFDSDRTEEFDVIMTDPPYDRFEPDIIKDLQGLLTRNGLLIVSHPDEPTEIDGFLMIKTRKYARAHITIYELTEATD